MARLTGNDIARVVRGRFLLAVSIAALLTLAACGSSSDGSGPKDRSHPPDQLRPIAWEVFGQPVGREIRIIANTGYCAGTPKPRIPVVHVAERDRRILITAMVTVNRANQAACDAVGYAIRRKVRLARPLAERRVYDAVTSPPRLRWPRTDP